MPNIEAAAALLETAQPSDAPAPEWVEPADVADEPAAPAPEPTDASTPLANEDAPEPAPDAAKLRVQEMQARLARLEAKNAERAEAKRLERERAELEEHRKSVAAERQAAEQHRKAELAKWQAALKNPITGFKELGMDPETAYRQLTDAVLEREQPEAKQAALVEQIRAQLLEELQPKLQEVEATKAALAEFKRLQDERQFAELQMARQRAEADFLKIVHSDGQYELADYYDDDELVEIGNNIADQFAAAKIPFDIKDVADEINRRLTLQLKRAEERRAARSGANTDSAVPPKQNSASASTAKPNTIGNSVASSVATSSKRALTREERLAKAAHLISKM